MRPNAVEVIRGLQQAMMMHILPELRTPFAQDQVQLSLMLLEMLAQEWDITADTLAKENRELREIFRQAASVISTLPRRGRPAELRGFQTALRSASRGRDEDSLAISALAARNNELRALLEKLVVACEEAEGNPALAALMPLRQRIYDHLWNADCRGWTFWDTLSFRGQAVPRPVT
jgi:hypothetical protein